MCRPVDCFSTINDLTESWAELLIRGITACPQGISAERGDGVVVQMRDSSWLTFMDKIGVPSAIKRKDK